MLLDLWPLLEEQPLPGGGGPIFTPTRRPRPQQPPARHPKVRVEYGPGRFAGHDFIPVGFSGRVGPGTISSPPVRVLLHAQAVGQARLDTRTSRDLMVRASVSDDLELFAAVALIAWETP